MNEFIESPTRLDQHGVLVDIVYQMTDFGSRRLQTCPGGQNQALKSFAQLIAATMSYRNAVLILYRCGTRLR